MFLYEEKGNDFYSYKISPFAKSDIRYINITWKNKTETRHRRPFKEIK